MYWKFLDAAVLFEAQNFTAINALHFGVLKKMGMLKEDSSNYAQIMESGDQFTLNLDVGNTYETSYHVDTDIDVGGFMEAVDPDTRLRWRQLEGSFFKLPGVANSTEIFNARLEFKSLDAVELSFEFVGDDGNEYVYRGERKISIFDPVRSWESVEGAVYEKESGERIMDSIKFMGSDHLMASLLPYLKQVNVE